MTDLLLQHKFQSVILISRSWRGWKWTQEHPYTVSYYTASWAQHLSQKILEKTQCTNKLHSSRRISIEWRAVLVSLSKKCSRIQKAGCVVGRWRGRDTKAQQRNAKDFTSSSGRSGLPSLLSSTLPPHSSQSLRNLFSLPLRFHQSAFLSAKLS